MREREKFLFLFFILIFVSVIILVFSLLGYLKIPSSILEKIASPIGIRVNKIFYNLPFIGETYKTQKTQNKNIDNAVLMSEIDKLKKENSALRDQFETAASASYQLLPANIVGTVNFVVDKGERDNIKKGQAVIFKNNLVGKVDRVSSSLSSLQLITNENSSFTVKTQTGALGIIKGDGKTLILDNILLSENIKVNDIVTTKGDLDINGIGYPPELVVGKIVSIDKNPSSLFQRAKVESFINFGTFSAVFVIVGIK